MTAGNDDLLAGLRSARPDPGYRPSSRSPEAAAMLAGILGGHLGPARNRRRVIRRKLALAAIPVMAAAVVAAGFLLVTRVPADSDRGRLSAASVGTAILDAVYRQSGGILRVAMMSKTTGEETETGRRWVYPAFPAAGQQVRYRNFLSYDGRPYQDVESIYTETADMDRPVLSTNQGPRSARIIGVDYRSRTWARFRTDLVPVEAIGFSPALIRSEIASGSFRVDGTVKLNGRRAVKVSFFDKPTGWHVTFWVDAHTYVPLRSVWFSRWWPGSAITTTTTYSYQVLPATPASLRLLDPVIPAGFTKSADIPGF
jgi:hypothetical protein